MRTFIKYLVNLLKFSVYLPHISWSNVFGKFVLIVYLVVDSQWGVSPLDLSFVKDFYVVSKKITKKAQKMAIFES